VVPAKLATLAIRDKSLNPGNYAVITVSDGSVIDPEVVMDFTPHLSRSSKSTVLRQMTEQQADEEFTLDDVVEPGTSLAGSGMVAAELIKKLIGEEVFLQPLTYLLRTGSPDGQDLLGATNFAILATRLLKEEKFGRMVAYQRRYNLTHVDLQVVLDGVNRVDVERMYNVEAYQPRIDLIWAAHDWDITS
jgi:6-phosphofructokinase 1